MTHKEKIEKVAEILKKRFPNLTVMEIINLAFQVVEALEDE